MSMVASRTLLTARPVVSCYRRVAALLPGGQCAVMFMAPMGTRHQSSGGSDSPRYRTGSQKKLRVAFRRQAPMHTEAIVQGESSPIDTVASQFDVRLRVSTHEPVHHTAIATWAQRCESAVATASSAGMAPHLVSELRRQHFQLMDTAQDALDHAHQQTLAAKAAAQEALALVREARALAEQAAQHKTPAPATHDAPKDSPGSRQDNSGRVAVDASLKRLKAAMARDAATARPRSAMDIRVNNWQLGAGVE